MRLQYKRVTRHRIIRGDAWIWHHKALNSPLCSSVPASGIPKNATAGELDNGPKDGLEEFHLEQYSEYSYIKRPTNHTQNLSNILI